MFRNLKIQTNKFQFIEQLDFTTKSVILSEAAEQAAKSKNLRTDSAENVVILPGSFDSLRSLRMTGAVAKPSNSNF